MNTNTNADARVVAAARERRFTAELAAVLGGDFARVDESDDPANSRTWLAAALVLLGLAVTVATALSASRRASPLQQPATYEPPPLPLAIAVPTAGHFALLPADAQNVAMFCNEANRDFAPLARLRELVAVRVNGPGFAAEWPVDCFAPFAALPKLEVLAVPLQPDMTAEHLRALARATTVRSLTLHLRRAFTADDVAALAAMPRLGSLSLESGSVDEAAVRALSDLPGLSSLKLEQVAADEGALERLGTVHRLRSLGLVRMGATAMGDRPIDSGVGTGLSPAVAAALRGLPILESLELETCEVTAAAIEELPTTLRSFGLTRSPDVGADVFTALQRLSRLRHLALDGPNLLGARPQQPVVRNMPGGGAAATPVADRRDSDEAAVSTQGKLLRALPLVRLDWIGSMGQPIREALSGLEGLREVRLYRPDAAELCVVAALPRLERLTVAESATRLADLECLRNTRSLRQLTLQGSSLSRGDVERLLPGVTVTVSAN